MQVRCLGRLFPIGQHQPTRAPRRPMCCQARVAIRLFDQVLRSPAADRIPLPHRLGAPRSVTKTRYIYSGVSNNWYCSAFGTPNATNRLSLAPTLRLIPKLALTIGIGTR